VYRDNTSREIDGKDLTKGLSAIDDAEARRVQHVEIMMPIAVLERVNIVDTPGLNSILPEHEAVARGFLQRADAVVWLFTGNQAGKSSEKSALDSIRDQGIRVLGVLNKIDQLKKKQIEEIQAYVGTELGERIEACVPISARRALEGKKNSGWDKMRGELEERFFQHARELKKRALNRRIEVILGQARQVASERFDKRNDRTNALRQAAQDADERMLRFVDEVVEVERTTIGRDIGLLYRRAAQEVLELVRPRKLPFGSHSASVADRDYLLGLLDSGYERVLADSGERCREKLQTLASEVLESNREHIGAAWIDFEELHANGLQLVDAEVFQSCLSFLRGFMRGGFVDRFFQVDLPKLELNEDSVYHALFRASPEIDSEISVPLATSGGRLLGALARRLEGLAAASEAEAFEMDAGLRQAVDSLSTHRATLLASLDGAPASKEG
jgi:hypothetical protein